MNTTYPFPKMIAGTTTFYQHNKTVTKKQFNDDKKMKPKNNGISSAARGSNDM